MAAVAAGGLSMRMIFAGILAATALTSEAGAQMNCTTTPHLAVDADGAPDSYRVDGNGLSYTCDGVFAVVGGVPQTNRNNARNWQPLCRQYWAEAVRSGNYSKVKVVGFLMGRNGPVVQGEGDPLPGQAYVTTTSLTIPGTPDQSQRHYVNAREIPFLVISNAYARRFGLREGDVLAVYRPRNGALAYAVYGDCCTLGEGSLRLHQDLGNDPYMVKPGGTIRAKREIEDPIWFAALTGTHTSPSISSLAWRNEIRDKGTASFNRMGGLAALNECISRHR
jgi:hypothetical protein